MKKSRSLILLLAVLLVAALVSPAASAECARHRWVEATEEEPAFCYRCGVLDYEHTNYNFPAAPFSITVLNTMNCRRYPNVTSDVISLVSPGSYTITQVQNGWGRLANGWISLYNPNYISLAPVLTIGQPDVSLPANMQNARVGDTVTFGRYEQDGNVYNGSEPIEWTVLDRTAGGVLLISKYGIDCGQYNTTQTSVSWETCTMRTWLNSSFLYTAFTAEEQASIASTTVKNTSNATYGTSAGRDTVDKVFLLSYDEAVKYFKTDADRLAFATTATKNHGAYICGHGHCWWWLRGPGEFASYACLVGSEGNANDGGNYVDRPTGGIRPVIWLGSSSGSQSSGMMGPQLQIISPIG